MMARLETLTCLVVISSFVHTASSSAILNYFSSRESSQANIEDVLVPEVYGGALTEFFQTLSEVGEGERSDDNLQSEDDLENIPEVDIDVEEFLLITDQELKARPRSDKIEAAISSAVELDQKSADEMSSSSASSMNSESVLPVSTSVRFLPTLQESWESSSTTTISTISEQSISTNSTELNDLASDSDDSISARVSNLQSNSTPTFSNQQTVSTLSIHSSLFESSLEVINDVATPTGRAILPALETDPVAASDKFLLHKQSLEIDPEQSKLSLDSPASPIITVLPSLYSPSVDSITTEHSVVNDITTSFDDLLLALEKLDTLNEAVEDLHTSQDQPILTDSNDHTFGVHVHDAEMLDVAQDRTDMVENNDEDDSDGFFASLYKWLA